MTLKIEQQKWLNLKNIKTKDDWEKEQNFRDQKQY